MNNIFSFKRFGLLFKKHTAENLKSYAMSLFVLTGILVLVLSCLVYKAKEPMPTKQQFAYFLAFFIIGGTIFTSTVFANLGDKRKAIAAITLPASAFEKFLVGWIYSYALFQLLFTGIFYGILAIVLQMGHWPNGETKFLNVFSVDYKMFVVFIIFGFLHGIVLYGAIFFQKMHFIKTAFAFFIIVAIIWLLNNEVLQMMIGQKVNNNPPFTGVSFTYEILPEPDATAHPNLTSGQVDLSYASFKWILIMFSALGVMFWFAAYYRFKEKKV